MLMAAMMTLLKSAVVLDQCDAFISIFIQIQLGCYHRRRERQQSPILKNLLPSVNPWEHTKGDHHRNPHQTRPSFNGHIVVCQVLFVTHQCMFSYEVEIKPTKLPTIGNQPFHQSPYKYPTQLSPITKPTNPPTTKPSNQSTNQYTNHKSHQPNYHQPPKTCSQNFLVLNPRSLSNSRMHPQVFPSQKIVSKIISWQQNVIIGIITMLIMMITRTLLWCAL